MDDDMNDGPDDLTYLIAASLPALIAQGNSPEVAGDLALKYARAAIAARASTDRKYHFSILEKGYQGVSNERYHAN